MTPEQHAALVRSLREDLGKYLATHMDEASVSVALALADRMTERAYGDGIAFGVQKERAAAQFPSKEQQITTDKSRLMAAKFLELVDARADRIMTSDLYTKNLLNAVEYARHMVNGGGYSGGESQLVFNQFEKLKKHFGA